MGKKRKKATGFGELLAQEKSLQNFEKKFKESLGSEFAAGVIKNPKGEVKMSDVLKAFIDPYLDLDVVSTVRECENLFGIAIVAWNVALMPKKDRQHAIDQFIEQMFKGDAPLIQQETREIIGDLIARKQKFFARHKRYIVDFELQGTPKDLHLSVASTLAK